MVEISTFTVRSVMASAALFASALSVYGANVSSVETKMGTLEGSASPYTAASLVYKTANDASSDCNRSVEGWYAGIQLNWASNQRAANIKAKVDDDQALNTVGEYTVYNFGDKTPSGCGMKNSFTSGLTKYMKTTEWYIYVTPEFMYSLNGEDYSATLTIGGNTYTITVPQTVELFDGDGVQWYPAIAVVDGKVYGDMGLAVEAGGNAAAAGKDMEFLVEPTGYPANVSAVKEGDVWKLVVNGSTSIETAVVTLSDAEITYDGKVHTVEVTTVMLGDVALTEGVDYSVSGDLSATSRGEYTVIVTGMGNFEGTATATWRIVNTTGTGSTVAASAAGSMTASGNDFTLSDSSKLEYDAENTVWYAGITVAWPKETKDSWATGGGGYAHYVKMDSVQVTVSDGSVSHVTQSDKFRQSLTSGEKAFSYLSTTTWKVPLSPEIVAAALAEEKTELVYTMTAGAFIWGNDTEGDPDGVAFQDYTITIPIDENLKLYDNYGNQAYPELPYVAQIGGKKYLSLEDALTASESGQTVALIAQDDYVGEYEIPEGVTAELGAFGSADATYVLSIDAVLTSDAECTVSTSETGYGVELSGEGPYTYNVVLQHVHNWDVDFSGSVLTATCVAEACPLDVKEYSMRLFTGVKSGATEDVDGKVYDGESMSRKAVYSDGFTDVFPDVATQFSVTKGGESVNTINDVGEYVVTMTVTGLGDEPSHELSKTVTILPVDISEATLVLTPATTTYNGTAQTVTPSVTVGGVTATLNDGLVVVEGSTCSATDIGTYSVTVEGTGNFTGRPASATWEIVNTTGSFKSVSSAVDGVGDYDSENNTLTVTDSTALEYSDGAWYAGITLEWPASISPLVYVKRDTMQVTVDGIAYTGAQIINGETSYDKGKLEVDEFSTSALGMTFAYVRTTTWKVRLTPEIIETALGENETELEYTMNAGAFSWSDKIGWTTYGNPNGVAFADYTITLPLDETVEFVLGEGEAYDLGDTRLTSTKIRLDAGAVVMSDSEQDEGTIYPADATSYEIVCTVEGERFVYTTKHVHAWTVAVAENGYELVATCPNDGCDVNNGKVTLTLALSGGDKTYDGVAITAEPSYGEGFLTVYPGVSTVVTVNGEEGLQINNAGEYVVTMAVSGVGDEDYTLTRNVTVSPLDITGAELVLDKTTLTHTGSSLSVSPSVTVGGFTATLDNGLEVNEGTVTATDVGEYSVTVKGVGNFTGISAEAKWEIVASEGGIIQDIKDDIDTAVTGEVAESAKAKVDLLAEAADEGNEQAVADWVESMKGEDAATFYTALANSKHVGASFELGTEKLITDESDVEVVEFESTEDGFTFAVTIDGGGIDAARVKAASIIQTATSLGDAFEPLEADRIAVSEGGAMSVKKGDNVEREFFKIVIKDDGAPSE